MKHAVFVRGWPGTVAGAAMRRCVMAGMLALQAQAAGAGAWTRAPGEGFFSAGAGYYATDDDLYEEITAATYVEYGLFEALTIGGSIEQSIPVGVASGQSGDLSLAMFARARLHVGAQGDPFSVQLGAVLPLGETLDTGLPQIDRERAVDIRALYGRGFATGWGDAFIDAQAGVRFRLDESADEIRIDLTAGLRPAPRWLVLVQSFNTIGLRNQDPFGGDFDVYKVAPAVGYEITEGVTLVMGAEREVTGRNIDRGLRWRASVWTTF